MNSQNGRVIFRKIRGKIVPVNPSRAFNIGLKAGAIANFIAAPAAAKLIKKQPVEPHHGFQSLGVATSIASGVIAGATLGISGKGFLLGQAASIGLDAASSAANVASFAGRDKKAARLKAIARQEGINALTGNAAFIGAAFAVPSSRRKIIEGAAKALSFFKGKIGAVL